MEDNSLDLLVLYSNRLDPSHVRYLADVYPINESAALVIPLQGDPILCSGQACHAWSVYKSKVKDVRVLPEVGEVAGTEYEMEGQIEKRFEERSGSRAAAISLSTSPRHSQR